MNRRLKIGKCSNCGKSFKLLFEDTCISGERGKVTSYGFDENEDVTDVEVEEDANIFCPYCKLSEKL